MPRRSERGNNLLDIVKLEDWRDAYLGSVLVISVAKALYCAYIM